MEQTYGRNTIPKHLTAFINQNVPTFLYPGLLRDLQFQRNFLYQCKKNIFLRFTIFFLLFRNIDYNFVINREYGVKSGGWELRKNLFDGNSNLKMLLKIIFAK